MAITEVKNNYYTQKETNEETRVKEQKKETNTYGSTKEYGDNIYENAAKGGGKVLSCNISFDGYDSITTQVHAVYEADPGTEEAKKLLEEARAKNKERRVQQE